MRITFKQNPRETGLRSVGAGPRGYRINLDGKDVGSVGALGGGAFNGPMRGWFYVVSGDDFTYRNTCGEIGRSLDEAKAAAKAYIVEQVAGRSGRKDGTP